MEVVSVAAGAEWREVRALFDSGKVVHVRPPRPLRRRGLLWLRRLRRLSREAGPNFCVESGTGRLQVKSTVGAPWREQCQSHETPWYCSTVLKETPALRREVLRHLGGETQARVIPGLRGDGPMVKNGAHAWVFVASPRRRRIVPGRAEHTDNLADHVAGTWHLQLAGTKHWLLRPLKGDLVEPKRLVCRPGDVLLIDTRAWRHSTQIPPAREPSISIARDFCYGGAPEGDLLEGGGDQDVLNVDAILAARPVAAGGVVLTEDDLPECSLPRSADPNCRVAEDHTGRCLLPCRAGW